MIITKLGKKMLSFFAVFFLTLCVFGCNFSTEVSDRSDLKEAKTNVEWLLSNFNFGEVINNVVKEDVIGNVGIAEDLDGEVSENDLRNGSYSEFMYGMSATFESSNPEVMNTEWVTYKKRAYVYGDESDPEKITGIETQYVKSLEFVVNRPEPTEEDVQVDITIKVKAPYQVGDQTYYHEGERTLTFNVLKKAETNTMTVGELEDYILANWSAFNAGTLFKDEQGNDLNVSIEGVVTEQVWGDGYDAHSFTMTDDEGNGIYIYGPQNPVNIGDRVVVTGKPATYNGTIQIGLDSTIEVISELTEGEFNSHIENVTEETSLEEWYEKYPTQATDHKVPGQRVKISGLFIEKTVDGYTNYAIQSTESDKFVQIYYKSYGAYEEQLLQDILGKLVEVEVTMYYCHSNGYWVAILNNYDYQPTLIEMSESDKLVADVATIKTSQTVKDGETVDLPKGTLPNGTVLGEWVADKEGHIDLETLVASLGSAKEDVKVTLTTTATNGATSQEVTVEVTVKYVAAEIAEKTVKELIELQEEMLETFKVTGTVLQWGNKLDTAADAATKYGNFVLQGEDGSKIIVYGATATESALAWDATAGKYKYTNAQDFLTNEITSQIKLGDTVQLLVVRTSYNGNPQLNAVVLAVNPEVQGGETEFGVVKEFKENVAYKLGFAHLNEALAGKEYFLNGEMNGYYGDTVEDHTTAADVYVVAVEGGYNLKAVKADGSVVYVNAVQSGTYTNIAFGDAATTVWTYNAEYNTFVCTFGENEFLLGTRSDKTYTTVGPVNMTYASTTCIVNLYGETAVESEPSFGVVSEIEEGQAYKLGFAHLNEALAGKEYFLIGVMNGYYGDTTEDHTAAADIYFIAVDGGYNIKAVKADGSVVYVNAVQSGTYTNIAFGDAATTVWTYNAEYNTLVCAFGENEFLLGTRSDKTYTTVGPVNMTYASTTCIVHVYGGTSSVTPEPPTHEHEFTNGECSCGEKDPNYVPPTVEDNEVVFDFSTGETTMSSDANATEAEMTVNGITLGYLQMRASGYDGNYFLMFQKNQPAYLYNKTAFSSAIVKVEVFIPSGASGSAGYFLSLHTEAAAGNFISETSFVGKGASFTIEATAAEGFKYFNLSSDATTTKNGQVEKIIITLADGTTIEPEVPTEKEEPTTTNKTVAELIAVETEMDATYKVTGKVVLWGNSLTSTATTPVKYGNFVLEGEDGSRIVVYGATATASALVWNAETGKYTYTNAQDFLTGELTSTINLGDTVELLVVRTSYNGNPQLNAVVLSVTSGTSEEGLTETLTMTATGGALASDNLSIAWTTEHFDFLVQKASSSSAIRTSDADHFRVYAGNEFDITGKNGEKMTQVVITLTGSSYAEVIIAALKTAGVTAVADGAVVTFTADAGSFDSLSFAEGKQFRIKTIEITYLA